MTEKFVTAHCPGCGDDLPSSRSLCVRCEATTGEDQSYEGDDELGHSHHSFSEPSLAEGSVVGERFRIVDVIGRGGMGEVYRADDLVLDECVALKVLRLDPRRRKKQRSRIVDELRLARRISHSNVCRVHDLAEDDDRVFLSMEYIEGEDLASLLGRIGRLPVETAYRVGAQIARGLEAMHEVGILHLDLKPSNVMIDRSGRALITDFGMARRVGLAPGGGTPAYMPPEQQSGTATMASDFYSLGLVLYELLTGRRAFVGPRGELARRHREISPAPPSKLVTGIDPAVEAIVLQCLEKIPAERPSSAGAIAAVLESESSSTQSGELEGETSSELETSWEPFEMRRFSRPELPDLPYPVLTPYTHPQLLAGRDRSLRKIERLLRMPVPILGLHAASGTGKSSLLLAGLQPRLHDDGCPFACCRYAWEPELGRRLLDELLVHHRALDTSEWRDFVDQIVAVRLRLGKPPVLAIDQFEQMLRRPDAEAARATLGVFLAATANRLPGGIDPPCRWILAYRQEYHGRVVAWLTDVLAEARELGFSGLDSLPHDLTGADRFSATSLPPLGWATPRADPVEEARRDFLEAIEAPLKLKGDDGRPRFDITFQGDGAERLATAFAKARVARPESPLTPELQVVLAHLEHHARKKQVGPGNLEIEVPADVEELIDVALETHLGRVLKTAFPPGRPGAARGRARGLLALRELAHATGRRQEGASEATLIELIGEDGAAVLERLAAPDARLVIPWRSEAGVRWVLSHDRLAEAVVRQVEDEGSSGGLIIDSHLLGLRRWVSLGSALYQLRGEVPSRIPAHKYRVVEEEQSSLLVDQARRDWWQACRRQRAARRRRLVAWSIASAALLILLVGVARDWAQLKAQRRSLLGTVAEGEPMIALKALDELASSGVDRDRLLEQLANRDRPLDILEQGLDGADPKRLAELVLRTVELLRPMLLENTSDLPMLASALWAVDYAGAISPLVRDRAQALRNELIEPLRRQRPPPDRAGLMSSGEWIEIPAGELEMGMDDVAVADDDEMPVHTVRLDSFWILRREVSNADLRGLLEDHEGEDELPARFVNWYTATVYAAWLGGRLPTEAEWEYAAKAGCPIVSCDHEGQPVSIDEVAWTLRNSRDPSTMDPVVHAGGSLEANPWGLVDMLGNLWEWTADNYGIYRSQSVENPWGPTRGTGRVLRGSSSWDQASWARPSKRNFAPANNDGLDVGFRPVIPVATPE